MKVMNRSVAQKNDLFRQTFIGCKVVMTEGVAHSSDRENVIGAVRSFAKFSEDNDPYQEHDFGSLEINGTIYFWKFDYYDDNYELYQEDGNRVLTIGRMDEY